MSEEIIEILDALAEKFGLAIDRLEKRISDYETSIKDYKTSLKMKKNKLSKLTKELESK